MKLTLTALALTLAAGPALAQQTWGWAEQQRYQDSQQLQRNQREAIEQSARQHQESMRQAQDFEDARAERSRVDRQERQSQEILRGWEQESRQRRN